MSLEGAVASANFTEIFDKSLGFFQNALPEDYGKEKVMSDVDNLKDEVERLKAENSRLKEQTKVRQTRLKVSEKGALSVYGLGRFPVTLYKEQWLKLLDMDPEIREFIKENDEALKAK